MIERIEKEKYNLMERFFEEEKRKYNQMERLYEEGKHQFNSNNYSKAIEKFDEALNIINSNDSVKNRIGTYEINNIKEKIGQSYCKLGEQKWKKYNTVSMLQSIDYFKKARDYINIEKEPEEYYYLYKAFYERRSDRTNNLYYAYEKSYNNYGLRDSIYKLYEKSGKINDLENEVNSKQKYIDNLNYVLQSLNNSIYNINCSIDSKNRIISNKKSSINEVIDKLNNLGDSLIIKSKEIDLKVKDITEQSEIIEKIGEDIKSKENFINEIKELEVQKIENINNMKTNNENLKKKNDNFIQILSSLENKLKN